MKRCRILFILMLLGFAYPALSQNAATDVRIDPIAIARELAAVEEPLELATFIRIAFIFSGVPQQRLADSEALIQTHIAELGDQLGEMTDPRQHCRKHDRFAVPEPPT